MKLGLSIGLIMLSLFVLGYGTGALSNMAAEAAKGGLTLGVFGLMIGIIMAWAASNKT